MFSWQLLCTLTEMSSLSSHPLKSISTSCCILKSTKMAWFWWDSKFHSRQIWLLALEGPWLHLPTLKMELNVSFLHSSGSLFNLKCALGTKSTSLTINASSTGSLKNMVCGDLVISCHWSSNNPAPSVQIGIVNSPRLVSGLCDLWEALHTVLMLLKLSISLFNVHPGANLLSTVSGESIFSENPDRSESPAIGTLSFNLLPVALSSMSPFNGDSFFCFLSPGFWSMDTCIGPAPTLTFGTARIFMKSHGTMEEKSMYTIFPLCIVAPSTKRDLISMSSSFRTTDRQRNPQWTMPKSSGLLATLKGCTSPWLPRYQWNEECQNETWNIRAMEWRMLQWNLKTKEKLNEECFNQTWKQKAMEWRIFQSDLKTKRQGNEECVNQTRKQKAMEWSMLGSNLQTKGNGMKNALRMLGTESNEMENAWILETKGNEMERERERERVYLWKGCYERNDHQLSVL